MSLFQSVPPPQTQVLNLTSSARYIQRARHEQFLPEQQIDYNTSRTKVITFKITSQDSFVDFANSYIRLKVGTLLNHNSITDATRAFSEGGFHAAIRRLEVETASGAKVLVTDNYNHLTAKLFDITMSKDEVESMGQVYGDSVSAGSVYDSSEQVAYHPYSGNVGAATWTLATRTLAALSTTPLDDYEVGQWITWKSAAGNFKGRIQSMTATTIVVAPLTAEPDSVFGPDLAATAVLGIWGVKNKIYTPQRAKVARDSVESSTNTTYTYTTVTFKPSQPFFKMFQWFPVFLLNGGLTIKLYLDDYPSRILVSKLPASASALHSGAEVQVRDIEYVCRMIQASENLRATYYNMFKGDGIKMRFTAYKWVQTGYPAATNNVADLITPGRRGVRYVLTTIQDDRHVGGAFQSTNDYSVNSWNSDCCADSLRAKLNYYDYRALSLRYPLDSQVNLSNDDQLNEPLEQLQFIFNIKAGSHRFSPWQWQSINTDGASANESKRLVLGCLLAKTHDAFTGMDFNNTPLQINYNFSGTHAPATDVLQRYFNYFIAHDNILHLQQTNGLQVMN